MDPVSTSVVVASTTVATTSAGVSSSTVASGINPVIQLPSMTYTPSPLISRALSGSSGSSSPSGLSYSSGSSSDVNFYELSQADQITTLSSLARDFLGVLPQLLDDFRGFFEESYGMRVTMADVVVTENLSQRELYNYSTQNHFDTIVRDFSDHEEMLVDPSDQLDNITDYMAVFRGNGDSIPQDLLVNLSEIRDYIRELSTCLYYTNENYSSITEDYQIAGFETSMGN